MRRPHFRPKLVFSGGAMVILLLAMAAPGAQTAAAQSAPRCEPCHGEIEFLRQHVPTLEEAQALFAPTAALAASAHGELTCVDCHAGLPRYPHGEAPEPTRCGECHEAEGDRWAAGLHALDGAADCTDCHGVHEVMTREALAQPDGIQRIRSACRTCHFEPQIAADEPHAASVSCAACHEPHRTLASEDEHATTHVLNQAATCGACHEDASAGWVDDAHGGAVPALVHPDTEATRHGPRIEPPACSACHGGHDIMAQADSLFSIRIVERCSECHEHYAETFVDSYHGQAHGLGSVTVADCQDCHGAHGIYPIDDPRSAVGEARLLETCQSCHPQATEGFTLFQPHADHNDREKYPYVYWSYHLMTALLIGVFTVFGAHTFLWLVRLGFDGLRGDPHGSSHDAGD